MRRLLLPALCVALTSQAHALIDTNTNGLSDLWEKAFNANTLFSAANPDHAPTADPDGDGWSNLKEAAAGTNPFDANTSGGLVRPQISHTPGTYEQGVASAPPAAPPTDPFSPGAPGVAGSQPILIDPPIVTLTWPTISGKAYQVAVSENLVDWTPTSGEFMGAGDPLSFESENVHSDGTVPTKLFMRVAISDTDSDGDNLTDWEEGSLGTKPFSSDTDRDGIPDNVEITNGTDPNFNHLHLDPDGIGLANAGLMVGLKANWTFEEANIPIANLFGKNEARCENMAPSTTPSWPILVPFQNNGIPGFLRRGFVSQGLPLADKSIFGDGKVFTGITNSFTLSFWHRFQKDSVKDGDSIYKCLWSLSDCRPAQSSIASNTLAIRRKNATEEEIYLGAYTWNATGGVPHSSIIGKSFTRPLGTADDGNWHHYTIVRTTGKYTLYIDGAVMPGLNNQSVAWLDIPLNKPTPTGPTDYNYDWNTFGRMAPSIAHNQTLGTFDRIRLWSRPLDGTESTALFREDIDNDGLWDVSENKTAIWTDTDRDGTREEGEYGFISSPLLWENTVRDTDGDRLTDREEQDTHQTDLAHPDTDGDLLPDGWETEHGLDPLIATGDNGGSGDPDGDGLSNLDEYSFVSDPDIEDTDGDGASDGSEKAGGSNPSDPSDNGQPMPPEKSVTIFLGIGDQSGSDSEDYVINIYSIDPVTGAEIRFHTQRSGGHGQYKGAPLSIFHKGQTYTFQIDWQSSTQGSSGYDPNAPGKGPDYDYTFKVEPQGDYLGKLIPSWDSATGATDGAALAVTGASNVADTQQEFETNYERRRVALVAPKLEWQAIEGFDNLDTHIDPWTNQAKGKRIFPCRKNPDDNQIRHKLKLVATGGLKGVELFVKSFDIDDSTDETFDRDPDTYLFVIDATTNFQGDDNTVDYLATLNTGQFWNNHTKAWGAAQSNKKFGFNGKVDFDFKVGMQPGSNYRAAASVGDAQGYGHIQITNPFETATCIGPELTQTANAIVSEPLTVWRRLWVENDSMAAIPEDSYGYKRNDLGSSIDPRILGAPYLASTGLTSLEISPVGDVFNFENLENGRLIVQNQPHLVAASYTSSYENIHQQFVQIAGNQSTIPLNSGYRLYDDDGYGLATNSLPRLNFVDQALRSLYKPAFIEVVDAVAFNPSHRRILSFEANRGVNGGVLAPGDGFWDELEDIEDSKSCWCSRIIAAYQDIETDDHDPMSEAISTGITPGLDRHFSVVYVETARDEFDGLIRSGFPNIFDLVEYGIILNVAHEIGHMPGDGSDAAHHSERGAMAKQITVNVNPPTIFNPATIFRFRNASRWQK